MLFSFLIVRVFVRLTLRAVRVDLIALSFGDQSPRWSLSWASLIVDTDGHRTVQAVVFEIVVSAAAFGPLCRVHQAVQLYVADGLIFRLGHFVCLLLLKSAIVELAQGAVELWLSLSARALDWLLIVVWPPGGIRIE